MHPYRTHRRSTTALRMRLHAIDPKCTWCGEPTVMTSKPMPNAATIDHVKCWAEAASEEEYHAESNQVLACSSCNSKRDREFQAAQKAKSPVQQERRRPSRKRQKGQLSPFGFDTVPVVSFRY